MPKKNRDLRKNTDLIIEDISVEKLLEDGLIENVEVSAEDPSEKEKADEIGAELVTDTENTPEKADASVQAAANAVPKQAEVPTPIKTKIEGAAADPVAAPQAAVDAAIDAAPEAEEPKTKTGIIAAVQQEMSKMTMEQLAVMLGKLAEEKDEDKPFAFADKKAKDEDESEDEDSDEEDSEDDEEDEEDEDEEDSEDEDDDKEVKESIDALMTAEKSLSEQFKSKATALFEAKVKQRVGEKVTEIQETYNARLAEEVEIVQNSLTEKVDSYLSYVVKEWVEKNQVAVEKGLRTEIAEGFIEGRKNLFKENYIEVPEAKENMVDSLNNEIARLEGQLAEQTKNNVKLNESVNALARKQVLIEASKDLASTEAAKLFTLTASVAFENAAAFEKKVSEIKETYFRKTTTVFPTDEVEAPINDAGQEIGLSSLMEVYSTALSRTLKK